MGPSRPRSEYRHRARFALTQWSLILHAGGQAPDCRDALNSLCKVYWYPIYAHVRRSGFNTETAQDLTQGFFAQILDRNDLATLDRGRGRFRSWLLASLKHFVSNERDRARARKRGGDCRQLPMTPEDAEQRYRLESRREATPEQIFERRWAVALLEQVLTQLGEEAARGGRSRLFEVMKLSLTGEAPAGAYRDLAAELGMSEAAVYVAAHRLRHRCRELLHQAVARTVDSPDEVEDEIRHLFSAMR